MDARISACIYVYGKRRGGEERLGVRTKCSAFEILNDHPDEKRIVVGLSMVCGALRQGSQYILESQIRNAPFFCHAAQASRNKKISSTNNKSRSSVVQDA